MPAAWTLVYLDWLLPDRLSDLINHHLTGTYAKP